MNKHKKFEEIVSVTVNLPKERLIFKLGAQIKQFYDIFVDMCFAKKVDTSDWNTSSSNSIDLRFDKSVTGDKKIPMKREDALVLQKIHEAFMLSIDNVYKLGKNEGKNLLLSLQENSITLDEINEKA